MPEELKQGFLQAGKKPTVGDIVRIDGKLVKVVATWPILKVVALNIQARRPNRTQRRAAQKKKPILKRRKSNGMQKRNVCRDSNSANDKQTEEESC